ncbi:non-specific lipid-transfer protein AP10-like protein [Corchorus olitorius]|uniref:Non-specific lipid-transfer protein AP10-like protein n=1 Tax=Corchorus olitorius TaxID=93759 RepID=A0A1R3II23_9ROSI|nr:non-specific lipid-transfer protein AP10-like protein [Corchorus olitorius]
MKGVVITILLMVVMVQFMAKAEVEATVTCPQVTSALAPCLAYLTTGLGRPLLCVALVWGTFKKWHNPPQISKWFLYQIKE